MSLLYSPVLGFVAAGNTKQQQQKSAFITESLVAVNVASFENPSPQNGPSISVGHALLPSMTQNSSPLIRPWEVTPNSRPPADTT